MKVNDKVKAFVGDKYIPGIVDRIEDATGYKRSYAYQKVWVEFADGDKKQFRDYDLIPIPDEKEKVAKTK
jgi:hypothetical protein